MPNCTDQTTANTEEAASLVLAAVAAHFTATNPTDVLESHSLLICVGAEAYNLADRRSNGEGQAMSKAAMAVMPKVCEGITRGEFARILRKTLANAGHDWPDGDNDPAIPRITGIPGPRTEPTPAKQPTVPVARPASKAGA